MEKVIRIGGSVIFSLAITWWLMWVFSFIYKLDVTTSYAIGGVIGVTLGVLTYLWNNKWMHIFKTTVLGWGIGIILGFTLLAIFAPNEAQGAFAVILFVGPALGIIGFVLSLTKLKYVPQ